MYIRFIEIVCTKNNCMLGMKDIFLYGRQTG